MNPDIDFIYASKSFWIIVGFLIYMSATLFLFVSTGVPLPNQEQTQTAWLINNGANIIKNILFAIAFSKPMVMSIDSSSGKIFSNKKGA